MGMGPIKCVPGFPTTHSSPLTQILEQHTSRMEASYRESQGHWLTALTALHDAVDAALTDDNPGVERHLGEGQAELGACNDRLSALAQALVQLRSDLFDPEQRDLGEPLIAREPVFATLDYNSIYRELATAGAVLPKRLYWDEAASRMRDGGARGGCRLLERQLRELQSDVRTFIAEVEAASRLPSRALADALHGASLAVARVMTGYTRLITTFGYVSLLCERAMYAYEQSTRGVGTGAVRAAG